MQFWYFLILNDNVEWKSSEDYVEGSSEGSGEGPESGNAYDPGIHIFFNLNHFRYNLNCLTFLVTPLNNLLLLLQYLNFLYRGEYVIIWNNQENEKMYLLKIQKQCSYNIRGSWYDICVNDVADHKSTVLLEKHNGKETYCRRAGERCNQILDIYHF